MSSIERLLQRQARGLSFLPSFAIFFATVNLIVNIMFRHRTAKADRLSASCVQLLLSSDTSPELEDDLALRKIRFSTYSNIVLE